jgi:urease accessory protein
MLRLLPFLIVTPVFAHTGAEHGLVSGLSHPFLGLDHLAFMVMVGALSRLVEKGWRLPFIFAFALVAGAMLGKNAQEALPFLEILILLTLPLAAFLLWKRPSLSWLLIFVVLSGVLHGFAHGLEAPQSSFYPFIFGMMVSTLALHLSGIIIAHILVKKGLIA